MKYMDEKKIKITVIKHLVTKEKHFIVVPEIGLGNIFANTRGLVRADIFVVNGYISIYEIKSEKDSLKRLDKQIEHYKKYANYVNIVLAEKFLDKIDTIDKDVGIYALKNKSMELIRKPKFLELSLEAYLSYWWGSELKKLFRGCKGSNTLRYEEGIKKLKSTLSPEQIKNLTLFRLKERYQEESDAIKEAIATKNYDALFPKREYKKNIKVTPLKDIPFGVINPICHI